MDLLQIWNADPIIQFELQSNDRFGYRSVRIVPARYRLDLHLASIIAIFTSHTTRS